ncbi:NADPH-dependent FMN reductase [Ornithinibacillus halotolerans]|uniref:FMN reductase n=1 Tax=Ornithinibacillus halotolerans TaxID=1274357 RepID=A0A916RX53_9BACI|nr:NAD(P)H-dependent oxidoreductase [Ornithinibacillus halotolerans]GGA71732.1 FMN reductase [Ornithinibacillus halotolerans]
MKLVGISGTLAGNKTSQAVHDVLNAVKNIDSTIDIELIDLKDYDIEFCRGEPLTYYNDETWSVVKKILNADFLVFGTPIYQASISGALKNLLDFFPEYAFKNKTTGIIATGASEKHFLVPEYQLRPILSYLKASIPSSYVFVHNNSFDIETDEIIDTKIAKRIQSLAEEMVFMQKSINTRNEQDN